MEHDSTDPQFDSFLGGQQTVPSGLNLSEFIKHRMEEVVMLTEAIEESPFRGQAFQRLPKHMRRRQMSHYIKRLPRRLQRPYLMSLKDGPPVPTKRPSRKYRRRPGNLLLEYNRRQKTSIWLETHIWHAKRFHMCTKWGYKLPRKPVNKSYKACYSAISDHCLLIDTSYYNCIELKGPENELLDGLKHCASTECGLTFAAKMYLSGAREGCVSLFHPDSYPYQAIGKVRFMWQPVIKGISWRKIWIWVHPSTHEEIVKCFKLLFGLSQVTEQLVEEDIIVEKEIKPKIKQKKGNKTKKRNIEEIKLIPKNVPFIKTPKFVNENKSVAMTLLKHTLNRFQLTGPLSQVIISQAFTLASVGANCSQGETPAKKRKVDVEIINEKTESKVNCWWEEYYKNETFYQNWLDQKNFALTSYTKPSDMPSNMILGLIIEDPRMRIPAKREKAAVTTTDLYQLPENSVNPSHSQSPIWDPDIRDQVSTTKLTVQQINEARSKKIVPGFDVGSVIPNEMQSRVPILLVQRPGRRNPQAGKLGLGSGWDIIAPAGFGMPIWRSLIFRGARTGGLQESDLLQVECSDLSAHLPPDSAAGEAENLQNLRDLKTAYFKLPPNKRANFVKLGVLSPFYPPWKILMKDWATKTEPEKVQFCILRECKILKELDEIVRKFTKPSADHLKYLSSSWDCLVPVEIECTGKGRPKEMALICIPDNKDFGSTNPVEPSHLDENEKTRKILKLEHAKLLKSLKRKRQKDRRKLKEDFANSPEKLNWRDIVKSNSAPSEAHSSEYNAKMERLWLPGTEGIENLVESCSRRILGFVVKGEFSYSKSRGLGLGYVTLPGLVELFGVCQRNKSKVVVLVRNRNQVQYRLGRLRIVTE